MIWILGSSLIKKAHKHAKSRPVGANLKLERYGHRVVWIGHSSLSFGQVFGLYQALVNCFGAPRFVIVHAGGNDIGLASCQFLREYIAASLVNMHMLTPNTTIIWSCILPRLKWRHSDNTAAMERVRMRINRKIISSSYSKTYCKAIMHPDFQDRSPSLFSDDCHLSFIGNDIFLNSLQCALETFINHTEVVVFPQTI